MKNHYVIYCVSVFLFFISCSRTLPPAIETVTVSPSVSHEEFFSNFVNNIEIIPLETREDLFIRNSGVLEVYKGDIYISNAHNGLVDDSRGECNVILRFDKSGKFLNKIGDSNRKNPHSYIFYTNSYLDSIAYIFSEPDFCVNKYTLSGDFISKDTVASLEEFKQAAFFDGAYVVNVSSYFPKEDNMLSFYNEQGEIISKKIPLKTKLRPHGNMNPSFTKYKNSLMYRDEYKDTIYQISNKGVISPRLFVDYGEERRNNKENFLRTYSKYADGDEYDEKPSSTNYLYYESDNYWLLKIIEHGIPANKYGIIRRFALKNKTLGQVSFVDFDKEDTMFNCAIQFLEDKKLYFLVQARRITQIPEWMRPYFVNLSVLDNVKEEDNDFVFIFNLK